MHIRFRAFRITIRIAKPKTYATVSTSNFLIQPLLATVHSFLYVHFRFRKFRIAISIAKPNRNNYYNTTKVSTTPESNETLISESNETDFWFTLPSFFHRFDITTPSTNCTISMSMQGSFLLGTLARICRENL